MQVRYHIDLTEFASCLQPFPKTSLGINIADVFIENCTSTMSSIGCVEKVMFVPFGPCSEHPWDLELCFRKKISLWVHLFIQDSSQSPPGWPHLKRCGRSSLCYKTFLSHHCNLGKPNPGGVRSNPGGLSWWPSTHHHCDPPGKNQHLPNQHDPQVAWKLIL